MAENVVNQTGHATGTFPLSQTKTMRESPEKSPLELARAARAAKRELPVSFKTEYLDDDGWIALVAANDWRLPQKNTPASSAGIAPWLTRLGIDKPKFRAWCGYNPAGWCAANPTWSLRALVGLLLEDFAPKQGEQS
jgi:hypothetical protein